MSPEPLEIVLSFVFDRNQFESVDDVVLAQIGHQLVFFLEFTNLVDIADCLVNFAYSRQPLVAVDKQEP